MYPVQRSAGAGRTGSDGAERLLRRDHDGVRVVGHTGTFGREAAEVDGRGAARARVETGVQLSSFLRVFAFAWRFGDQNLLFARELTDTSRMVFRRA
jgi:hypothetical protein